MGVEGVHPTKRELDSPARGRETTPRAELGTSNEDFNQNRIVRYMPPLHVNLQVLLHVFLQSRQAECAAKGQHPGDAGIAVLVGCVAN